MDTKTCLHCGEVFERPSYLHASIWERRRYCSRKCGSQKKWKERPEKFCLTCGKQIMGFPHQIKSRTYCSHECSVKRGAESASWKNGGRFKMPGGYLGQLIYPEHPFYEAMGRGFTHGPKRKVARGRQVLEHRLVMAEHLGRPLKSYETIHHLNGKRDDNRLENLELRVGKHGSGAALCCADCGSTNLVHRA